MKIKSFLACFLALNPINFVMPSCSIFIHRHKKQAIHLTSLIKRMYPKGKAQKMSEVYVMLGKSVTAMKEEAAVEEEEV